MRICLIVILVLAGTSLVAHPLSVSYAQFSTHDRVINAIIRLPMDDLDLLLRLDRDLDGQVSSAELETSQATLQTYVDQHLLIRSDDHRLGGVVRTVAPWRDPTGFQYVEIHVDAVAPASLGRLSIESDFLTELYPAHKTLAEVRLAGRSEEFVFERNRVYEGSASGAGLGKTAASFARLGVEHIFTGYDHILFLFGLLLIGSGLKNVVAIVTSFTVAHSATLALATLGVVQPIPWMVEAAIALSIAYIGFENLLVRNPRYRWKITFAFGLVHGFGFASVLRDMHLPRAGLIVSLFSFNLGVEIGQIAIVGLMYPAIAAMAGTPYRAMITRVASSAIAVVGLVWFYQRIP